MDQSLDVDCRLENIRLEKFVLENPYPSYDEIIGKLGDHIEIECEYGKMNHVCCKIIYDNPTNEELIIEMGKRIYNHGGMQALQANHVLLKYFSPYWQSTDMAVKCHGRYIELLFQSVTPEWKC